MPSRASATRRSRRSSARATSGGPFLTLWDFCERVDARAVNKKAIEALIKCGAFGSTGATRRGMLEVLEQAQGAGQKAQQDALIGQASIFDLGERRRLPPVNGHAAIRPPISTVEFDQHELLAVEKEAIGLFISAHPLKAVRAALTLAVDCSLAAVVERPDKEVVTVGGIVTEARKIRTRTGTDMMFVTLDDLDGQVEVIVFGATLEKREDAPRRRLDRHRPRPRRPEGGGAHDGRRAVGRDLSTPTPRR